MKNLVVEKQESGDLENRFITIVIYEMDEGSMCVSDICSFNSEQLADRFMVENFNILEPPKIGELKQVQIP